MKVRIKGDANKAADALLKIRQKGLLKVAAIDPNSRSAPTCKTFKMPHERDQMRDWIEHRDGKFNLYFEWNVPRKQLDRKSREADIGYGLFVYVDCDPVSGETIEEAQARHHKVLNSGVVPAPTHEFVSGNGTAAAWRLEQPIKFDRPEAVAQAKALSVAIAQALGGKAEGFDSCQSVDHLYRIPNTVNLPDARKRAKGRTPVVAGDLKAFPNRRYKPEDFPPAKMLAKTKDAPAIGAAFNIDDLANLPTTDRVKTIIQYGKVEGDEKDGDDSRSAWRCEAVCTMLRNGISAETILGILIDPQYAISKRILAAPTPEEYARKEIERLRKRVAAEKARELDEDFDEDVDAITGDETTATPKRKTILPTPFVYVRPELIPRRQWIYKPSYIRKFIGLTTATGGAGKSSLILVELIAMASGKNLLGIDPEVESRTWYWNGEDPQEELQRRTQAVMKHYHLEAGDLEGRFFLDSGRDLPIRIAEVNKGVTKIVAPVITQTVEALRDNKIDVLAIDPFVSSHGVPENDNNAIDQVAKQWADVADKANCNIQISHHTRKTNGEAATVEDSRGASALNNAARTRRAINSMTQAEALRAGIPNEQRRSYFRADLANSSMIPPADSANWYKFVSVDLGNTPEGMGGDSVGVVTAWDYKKAIEVSDDDAAFVMAELEKEKREFRKEPSSPDWIGYRIAKVLSQPPDDKAVKKNIVGLIKKWVEEGKLEVYEGMDDKRRPKTFIRIHPYYFG